MCVLAHLRCTCEAHPNILQIRKINLNKLQKKDKNRFILGERLKQIARLDLHDIDVKFISKPLLQKSANNYGVTFFLSRLRDQGVEIIYVETPSKSQISFLHPGHGFRPMHACSCAKVIAAYASDKFQLNIIHSRVKSSTRNTRVNPSLLISYFKKIRLSKPMYRHD